MKKIVMGILAHVDAGKTTLSESMLYESGKIRRLGRVDKMDAYLDTYELEKARGITIFSKQAVLNSGQTEVILVDTPGHVDFSAEMERTLQILDYAILVISGADGVQGHTKTLWNLLRAYDIPVFLFVNKMDQPGTDPEAVLKDIQKNFGDKCVNFDNINDQGIMEELALSSELAMENYLETGQVPLQTIQTLIFERSVFPVYFGSALKLMGTKELLKALDLYTLSPSYPETFGARVFKISRDSQGNRLSHLKITGGSLTVRDLIQTEHWEEKVNQIRIYSGDRFEAVSSISAGGICAVTGLSQTKAGEGLGEEATENEPILEPVLSYRIEFPEGVDPKLMLGKLALLEEEEPQLQLFWNEEYQEINVKLMGEVQTEVLAALILERFDTQVTFGEGQIVYKETLLEPVEGVGHFEPLRHYAEVHLVMEPLPRGSGLVFEAGCSEEILGKNWQRLVLSHLKEKVHRGVLTGSPVTDLKITLVSGRAHEKHTEGGDFREATYRAVRQGLKEGQSVLLEPYYQFRLELPSSMVGRAMTDIDHMNGSSEVLEAVGEDTVLVGRAPVLGMRNYHKEVVAYTKGGGRLSTSLWGYDHCHNAEAVISQRAYDSERDLENPTGSVFCSQGSGFTVPWHEVKAHMHLEATLKPKVVGVEAKEVEKHETMENTISLEEIDQIMNSTFYANKGKKSPWKKTRSAHSSYYESLNTPSNRTLKPIGTEYLLVDGYNIVFAWEELSLIAKTDLEAARIRLLDLLCNYQGMKKCKIIVVFDAYRVEGRRESVQAYNNIHVVYTAEAQTADQYIEKFAHDHQAKNHVTVATSDGLQQVIIRGAGCDLLSARDLKYEVDKTLATMKADYLEPLKNVRNTLSEALSAEVLEKLEKKGE